MEYTDDTRMRNLTLVVILLAIIAFSVAGYFLISKFSPQDNNSAVAYPSTSTISQSQTPTQANAKTTATQTTFCQANQLTAKLTSQGAAGSIYDALEITNMGTKSCELEIGNIVRAMFDDKYIVPKNIVIHYVQTIPAYSFTLVPGAKVYSQIHYPNGPQCQSGIEPIQISFVVDQSDIIFKPGAQSKNLMIQACKSDAEKTTVDIWPLSKNPIN